MLWGKTDKGWEEGGSARSLSNGDGVRKGEEDRYQYRGGE